MSRSRCHAGVCALLLSFVLAAPEAAAQEARVGASHFSDWSVSSALMEPDPASGLDWGRSAPDFGSAVGERFVGGWIFGTLATLGVGAAAAGLDLKFSDEWATVLLAATYTASTSAGIVISLERGEERRLGRILAGTAAGAIPIALAGQTDFPTGPALLLLGWIAAPLLGAVAHGGGN